MLSRNRILRALAVLLGAASLASCSDAPRPPAYLQVAGGDAERGRAHIHGYGCGACHVIEGIRGARGTVGPPLADFAQRTILAGILPNTPRFLVPWLMDPVALDPRTTMPAVGLTEEEARDIAAYLYTLGASRTPVYPPDPPLPLQDRKGPPWTPEIDRAATPIKPAPN